MRTEKYDLIHSLSERSISSIVPSASTLPSPKHDDAINHGEQRVQVVRHQKHRDAEVIDQRAHELIECARGGWIQSGGRFVQKQHFGLERQCARDRGALAHAA